MDAYRNKLKRQIVIMSSAAVIAAVLVLLSYLRFRGMDETERAGAFFQGFQSGLFFGWVALMVIGIVINLRAVMDKERLKKLYIKENDERKKAIVTSAQAKAYAISLFALMIAAVISGFYSYMVFYTLLAVVIFIAVTGGIAKLVMQHKY